MNYRYVPDANGVLKAAAERRPTAPLHEIQTSHPMLRSMSLDHLSLLLDQLACGPGLYLREMRR
jgi:hypothetical protein